MMDASSISKQLFGEDFLLKPEQQEAFDHLIIDGEGCVGASYFLLDSGNPPSLRYISRNEIQGAYLRYVNYCLLRPAGLACL